MQFPNSTVTPADIEGFIKSEHYFTARHGVVGSRMDSLPPEGGNVDDDVPAPLRLLTFCVLVLKNGFTVTGISACADPARFNEELGKKIARENAVKEVWPLLGFMLRDQLHEISMAQGPSDAGMTTHFGQKVVHARLMNRRDYNILRGWELPADENGDDEGYLVEYADGGTPNVPGYRGYVSWSPAEVFERAYGSAR